MTDIALPSQAVAAQLGELVECLCETLTEIGAGPTCWCGLYPGAFVSWEHCADCGTDTCGMGYVRLAGVFPYDVFPQPIVDDRCVRPLAWAVEVGALRCLPTGSDGEPPSTAAMGEVALRQVNDAYATYWAMKCCGPEIAISMYQPVGPEGGCVGGLWTAFFAGVLMATVSVNVDGATVISALNTPGGAVYEWRDQLMQEIELDAFADSPVNNPLNAKHRGGVVGTYKRSWYSTRAGSNGHQVRLTVGNRAEHAIYVEEGRSASMEFQVFSWTAWGGEIHWVGAGTHANFRRSGNRSQMGRGTSSRGGRHILKNSTNANLIAQGLAPGV